jgi:ribose 5-phosphate isomerase
MGRVDDQLNSIKGGGACQLREKVLAEAAETWVIVADYRKNSKLLGTNVGAVPSCLRVPRPPVIPRFP